MVRIAALVIAVVVAALSAIGLAGCSDDTPPAKAAAPQAVSIKGADPIIEGVETRGKDLVIRAYQREEWDAGDFVFAAGDAMRAAGKALKAGATDAGKPEKVFFLLSADAMDRLGHTRRVNVFGVSFKAADLRDARYENLSAFDVIDLANAVYAPRASGRREIAQWCLKNIENTPHFCRQAVHDTL